MTRPSRVRGLGEIALRVNDLDAMQQFYADVVGLELMRRFPESAFFKIAGGYGGHTQILALFDRGGVDRDNALPSSLDHLALEIGLEDYEAEKQRLIEAGASVAPREFAWVHWRSLFLTDPEGNTVEFVCHDPTVL